MSYKEQHDEPRIERTRPARLACRPETSDAQRRTQSGDDLTRSLRAVCDQTPPVRSVGTRRRSRGTRRVESATARSHAPVSERRTTASRNRKIACGARGAVRRAPRVKKGALAVPPERHSRADEQQERWARIARAERLNPRRTRTDLLTDVGWTPATFSRWLARAADGTRTEAQVLPEPLRLPPTPDEIGRVGHDAEVHPLLGDTRVRWARVDANVAFLRPWRVHAILQEHDLLGRRAQGIVPLDRPAEPAHPDQRGHTARRSLKLNGRWCYRIEVRDAARRYLVYGEVLWRAHTDIIVLAAQRARATWNGRQQGGEPEMGHARGPQFVGQEGRLFIRNAEVGAIPTRAPPPQSNGRVERLPRTTKEEARSEPARADLFRAREALTRWQPYYNQARPHPALHSLHPVDYYRGDPIARLAECEEKLRCAANARADDWRVHTRERVKERAENVS
jgi:hypothetical protein